MLQPPSITVIDYNGNRNFDLQNISRTQAEGSCPATENLNNASVKLAFDFVAHRGHA